MTVQHRLVYLCHTLEVGRRVQEHLVKLELRFHKVGEEAAWSECLNGRIFLIRAILLCSPLGIQGNTFNGRYYVTLRHIGGW